MATNNIAYIRLSQQSIEEHNANVVILYDEPAANRKLVKGDIKQVDISKPNTKLLLQNGAIEKVPEAEVKEILASKEDAPKKDTKKGASKDLAKPDSEKDATKEESDATTK